MTRTLEDDAAALRSAMSGPVITPGGPDYDEARRVWNAGIDRRPAVIARCARVEDVVAAVRYAQAEGLEIAVRGGAHNMAGAAVGDDGLMIDLSLLREITVDPAARRARVGGGALLSDLDAATAEHGLAVPAGLIGHTGVGGLTLGGGMGWLTRRFGLTVDNLVSAEVVVADGRVLRASAESHPDLFWALRGGGGNFGVVTEFEFALHELEPMVAFGLFFWDLDRGAEVLGPARDLIASLDPELNIVIAALNAPPAPFVPEQYQLQPGYALLVAGFDGTPAHERAVSRIREALPPLFDMVTPMPYVELQKMLDEGNAWGFHAYEKNSFVAELSDDLIETVTEQVPRKHSPMSLVLFYLLDGAYSRVAEADTAFGGGRSPRLGAFLVGFAPDPDLLAADRRWVRDFWEAMRPHAIDDGGYVNAHYETDEHRVRATYGPEKYERLARIKGEYDPGNVFHRNANIKPA